MARLKGKFIVGSIGAIVYRVLIVVLAYRNKYNNEEFQYFENMGTRVNLSLSLKLPKHIQHASLVHCWIYFASADGKQVSQSQYFAFSV